jgi:hypothetical protein
VGAGFSEGDMLGLELGLELGPGVGFFDGDLLGLELDSAIGV